MTRKIMVRVKMMGALREASVTSMNKTSESPVKKNERAKNKR
jgi:hypothetical protein